MNSADLQLAALAALERCTQCRLVGEIAVTKQVDGRTIRKCRTCCGFAEDPDQLRAEREMIGRADRRRLAPAQLERVNLAWKGATPVRIAA